MRITILRVAALVGIAVATALVATTTGACNAPGTCPAKESIEPGGACSNEELQCAYDLATPSAACDGTNTTVKTSCICTSGAWECPAPFSCDAGAEAGDDAGGEAGDDGGGDAGEAGSNDAPTG